MSEKKEQLPKLETGLLTAMQAIDRQVSRELQRTPAEREEHGVQKWEPFQKRIEAIASMMIEKFGDGEVTLDSFVVLAQATTKALSIVAEDLGVDGLGDIRARYCRTSFETIARDMRKGLELLEATAAAH